MASDQQNAQAGRRPRNPVFAAALVLYGTLALLWATVPDSVVSWLQGLNSNVVEQQALRAAEAVQTVSDRIYLSAPYRYARAAFLREIGDE